LERKSISDILRRSMARRFGLFEAIRFLVIKGADIVVGRRIRVRGLVASRDEPGDVPPASRRYRRLDAGEGSAADRWQQAAVIRFRVLSVRSVRDLLLIFFLGKAVLC